MLSEKAISAKKVLEFYSKKLSESDEKEAVFASQYANLHMLRYRIQAMLDMLESYKIEVE